MIFDCGCEFHQTEDGGWTWDDENINFQCPKVWRLICSGNTSGVFQLDAMLGQHWSRQVKPENINEWSDLIAIIRPGMLEAIVDGKSQTQRYVDRKHGKESVAFDHPKLEEVLGPTQATMPFQEQAMRIATDLAGFTMAESDTYIRKGIGKKIPEVIAKAKEMFIEGCLKNNISKELAERIFTSIEAAQRYSFNRSHSLSYALDGYIYSAYIKAHFPLEFHCTELDFAKGKQPKTDLEAVCDIIEDALKMDIKVMKPDLRYLNERFSIVDGTILYGLTKIKHLGPDKIRALPELKDATYIELIAALDKINKTSAENLIKSGSCDWIKAPRSKMLADYAAYSKLNVQQKEVCVEESDVLKGIQKIIEIGPSTKSKLCYNKVSLKKLKELENLLVNPIRQPKDTPQKIIDWEKETLGRSFTFDEALTRYWDGNYKELIDVKHHSVPLKDQFLLSAVLRDFKEIYTKKKQEPMARITVYSLDWVSDAVIFPRAWELCKHAIESNVGQPLLFKARMNFYNEQWGLVIEEIEDV